jgi:hypothetical protein
MANAFNLVSKGFIFQELHVANGNIMQLIPFVHALYAFESPLFYSNRNHVGNVSVILFTMGTCQGDPLRGALFTLAHFRAFHFITNHFPSCLFPSIIDDIHIIGLHYIVSFAYEHFQIEFYAIVFLSNLINV